MRLNLQNMRLDVEETVPRDVRLERVHDAHTKVSFEKTAQQEELQGLEAIRDNDTTARLTMGQTSLRVVLLALGIGLVAVDAIVQFVVNSFNISTVSPFTWMVVSPFIALALGGITHGTAHALTYDPTRPQRSVRRCLQYAGGFGMACALALAVFLFSRTASEDLVPYLVTAVSVSLWTLAEALPITGGLLTCAAHALAYPALHARRIRHVKERLADLETFLQWLEEEERRLTRSDDSDGGGGGASAPPAAPSTGPTSTGTIGRALTAAALLLALLAPTLTACARAADIGRPTTTSTPSSGSTPAAPALGAAGSRPATSGMSLVPMDATVTCDIAIDGTSSVNAAARDQTVEAFADGLPVFLRAFKCRELWISHFTNEGAFAPKQGFQVPLPAAVACADALPITGTAQVPARFFDQFRRYYVDQGLDACRRRQQAAAIAADAAQQHFLATARTALLQPGASASPCTAIWPVLTHFLVDGHGPRVLVVATDAADSCTEQSHPLAMPRDARVLFVLIPSVGPLGERGPEALARAAQWQALLPGLTVLLFHELTAWNWPTLAALPPATF